MKSIVFLQSEIKRLTTESAEANDSLSKRSTPDSVKKGNRGLVRRNKKKIADLKFYVNYLHTEPTQEFLDKELDRINNRISGFMKIYLPLNIDHNTKAACTAHKKSYEKEMGILKLRKQLTAINYIAK